MALVELSQFTGEIGGLLALSYATGAISSFGFCWVFFMIPTRKMVSEAKAAYERERTECDQRIGRLEAKHAVDVQQLNGRILVLEQFLNVQTLGNLNQARQISNSAQNVVEDAVEVRDVAREIIRQHREQHGDVDD